MSEDYVMYCIFSKEAIKAMGGNRGKLASMAGHAYLHAWWDANYATSDKEPFTMQDVKMFDKMNKDAQAYRESGFAKKVTLAVDTTEQLLALYERIKDLPHGKTLVVDRALTVFEEPTTVCIGYGPVHKRDVPYALSILKVLI